LQLTSLYIAIALNCIAVLVLLGAVWMSIRGLGGTAALRSEVLVLTTAVERADERITREVKARAGQAGADKVAEERSIAEQAAAHLANPGNVTPISERPKRPVQRR